MRIFCTLLLAFSVYAQRDQRREEPNEELLRQPEAIEAGKKLFAGACSGCHGVNGEGGRGPSLVDGQQVRRATNQQLIASIKNGIPGGDMPPFPLPDDKILQLVAFVRSLSAPAFESRVPGDPNAGSSIFFGKGGCLDCHMIRGRGGFLGPDLSNIGMLRAPRLISEGLLAPDARITEGYQAVTVTTLEGKKIAGVARNNTNYSIQILDANGELHLLLKKDLREVVFQKKSLMPGDYKQRLTAAEIQNVLAFLSRQAIRPEPPRPRSRERF